MENRIQTRRHIRRRSQVALCEALESRVLLSGGPYTFSSVAGFAGETNGKQPQGLVMDTAGNLFGVTAKGGPSNYGTIFEIAAGTTTITTLATFTGPTVADPDNGISPRGTLVLRNGTLYGITTGGGDFNKGTIWAFPLTNGTASSSITTLASFNQTNGAYPYTGLVADSAGDLFGTTLGSKRKGDRSTVFELPAGSNIIEVLATFTYKDKVSEGYKNQLSGQLATDASGLLAVDSSGSIFGTTEKGGSRKLGTIFQISSDHTLTTLFTFDSRTKGAFPGGTLLRDNDGNLIGLTASGGSSGRGSIFEFYATSSTLSTLASFTGSNGSHPLGTLITDASGNLFGTTSLGGSNGCGTVFELSATSSTITTLYSFKSSSSGSYPTGPLVLDAAGNFWGTTYYGGKSKDKGTVFVLLSNVHIAVTQLPLNVASGERFTLVVNIRDAANNLVPVANGKLTVKVLSAPRGGKLLGTRTVSIINGVATFANLALKGAGSYTLRISGSMLTNLDTDPITVLPTV